MCPLSCRSTLSSLHRQLPSREDSRKQLQKNYDDWLAPRPDSVSGSLCALDFQQVEQSGAKEKCRCTRCHTSKRDYNAQTDGLCVARTTTCSRKAALISSIGRKLPNATDCDTAKLQPSAWRKS
eukprot:1230055-Pyramimonas_sp.AAC.1